MPKRACPFDNDLLPQIKIHIREKQVNNGVSSDERMKHVYDRTLNMLKAGMKIFSDKLNTSQMDLNLSSPQPSSFNKFKTTGNLKQMLLTDKLQLKASDKIMDVTKTELCGCCRIIDHSAINKCYYCDQILCSSCLSPCSRCSELFCQNCSLPVYNCEEQNMCLNCYR
ncbi:hypothetical protein HN011_010432 [Eciton burchellii]|nr:hypothetical protein HN011_010432 [Eciton burchellii]